MKPNLFITTCWYPLSSLLFYNIFILKRLSHSSLASSLFYWAQACIKIPNLSHRLDTSISLMTFHNFILFITWRILSAWVVITFYHSFIFSYFIYKQMAFIWVLAQIFVILLHRLSRDTSFFLRLYLTSVWSWPSLLFLPCKKPF